MISFFAFMPCPDRGPPDRGYLPRFLLNLRVPVRRIRARMKEPVRQAPDDIVRGEIFFPFTGEIGGGAAFAVNAIHGTGLEREQVDAEGKPEPAGRNGSENTFCLNLFHVSSKIL